MIAAVKPVLGQRGGKRMRVLILTMGLLLVATAGPALASDRLRCVDAGLSDVSAAKKKKVAKPQPAKTTRDPYSGIGAGRHDPSRVGHSRIQSYRN
jgi:hypothetical protein